MPSLQRQRTALALYASAGGFADAASYLRYKTFTGHLTGNTILLVISLVARNWTEVLSRVVAIGAFTLCTALGFRLAARPQASRRLFALQAILLVALFYIQGTEKHSALFGILAFCCCLGLQNGVVTSAMGVNLHSTFVSGDVTSLLRPPGKGKPGSRTAAVSQEVKREVLLIVFVFFALGALLAAGMADSLTRWLPLALLFLLLLAAVSNDGADDDNRSQLPDLQAHQEQADASADTPRVTS